MSFQAQAPQFRRRMAPLAVFAGLLVGVLLPGVNAKRLEAERVGEAVLWAQQLGARLGEQALLRPILWGYDSHALYKVTDDRSDHPCRLAFELMFRGGQPFSPRGHRYGQQMFTVGRRSTLKELSWVELRYVSMAPPCMLIFKEVG